MLRKVSNKKGQIGEILVIVVLIILAVLGVMKYVLPMFNKSNDLQTNANQQMGGVANSTQVNSGDLVQGSQVASVVESLRQQNYIKNSTGTLSVTIVNSPTVSANYADISKTVTFADRNNGNTNYAQRVDESAQYLVGSVVKSASNETTAVTFTKQ